MWPFKTLSEICFALDFVGFKTGSSVSHAGLNADDSLECQSSCLQLLSAEPTGVHPPHLVYTALGTESD